MNFIKDNASSSLLLSKKHIHPTKSVNGFANSSFLLRVGVYSVNFGSFSSFPFIF